MPKNLTYESVFQEWTFELTFQMQALLTTAMRGPDNCPKHNSAKSIVRYLRGIVLKPAGSVQLEQNDNDFMWGNYENYMPAANFYHYCIEFWNDHDAYPHHFIMHLVHCAQVVSYKHPNAMIRKAWKYFYSKACESFHMYPESEEQMNKRLNDFKNEIPNNS